jgi:hypothetical protein
MIPTIHRFPEHEREQFTAHFRGLMELWAKDNAIA